MGRLRSSHICLPEKVDGAVLTSPRDGDQRKASWTKGWARITVQGKRLATVRFRNFHDLETRKG